eukprot:2623692-Rhodomonas_salina.2
MDVGMTFQHPRKVCGGEWRRDEGGRQEVSWAGSDRDARGVEEVFVLRHVEGEGAVEVCRWDAKKTRVSTDTDTSADKNEEHRRRDLRNVERDSARASERGVKRRAREQAREQARERGNMR